jgi:uncharacterized delta-60 repeat protein
MLACVAILWGCGHSGGNSPEAGPTPKAAGQIDTTFGEGGIRRISYASPASDVQIDSQGRIHLASYSSYVAGAPSTVYFTRVLADGNWDTSVLKLLPSAVGIPSDARVTPLATGGFVATQVGFSIDTGATIVVAQRFDDSGNADPTYGSSGTTTFNTSVIGDLVGAPDGSIVVFGASRATNSLVVFRLDARGQRDPVFEQNAQAALAACGTPIVDYYRAARRSDGRIVVALKTDDLQWCVAQLSANGTPDPGFGTGGRTIFSAPVAAMLPFVSTVLALPGGGAAVVVRSLSSLSANPLQTSVFWFTASGQIDSSHGGLRSYSVDSFPIGTPLAATVQSDGKVLVMGRASSIPPGGVFYQEDSTKPRLVRLDSQGNPDATFGPAHDGFVTLDAGGNRLTPGRAIASTPGAVYPAGSAAPSGMVDNTGYNAVSVMRVFTGE